ncbi:MAG: glycosyltransferase family 2 protein [Anaerolineaceae bacterium]|jgi:glycosyltransferase involved in cell wall biosynthesis
MYAVSVIIATHNRRKLLERAIDSIITQTFQNFEIIVTVDAAIDDTLAYLEEITKKDGRVRYIVSEENIGPGAARNNAIEIANGEFIAIMDDDDIAIRERLEKQLAVFDSNPETGLVYSTVAHVDDKLNVQRVHPDFIAKGLAPVTPDEVFEKLYLSNCFIQNTTIMVRKSALGDLRYPVYPWSGEDWLLMTKLAAKGVWMKAIPEPLVLMRRVAGKESLTAKQRSADDYLRAVGLVETLQEWLKEEGISRFEHLDNKALANKYHYGFRENMGKKKTELIFKAIRLDPLNKKYWKDLLRLAKKKILG